MTDDAKKDEAAEGDVSDESKPESEESKAEETKAEETKAEPEAEEPKDEPQAEEPKDEPKAEEPKDEPKAEEPKAEEPKDEPKAEEPKDEPKAEEPKDEPKAEEPKDEPKAEEVKDEPKAEEPKSEEPAPAPAPAPEPAPEPEPEPEPVVLSDLGYLIEFESEESLKAGCEQVRDAGYAHWDAHTPYPVHGLDQSMGIKPTVLPWLVFGGGLTGCIAGMALQMYTNGPELPFSLYGTIIDTFVPSGYPFVVSGKPIFSIPANIPVTFELTILLSAFAAFFSVWGLSRLPKWYHPVFNSERFKRATQDRFFISILAKDPLYDAQRTKVLAESLGGSHVEQLMGEEA